jgi:hypothetical protein
MGFNAVAYLVFGVGPISWRLRTDLIDFRGGQLRKKVIVDGIVVDFESAAGEVAGQRIIFIEEES